MFSPILNGTSIEIQGLTCHLPPEGYVYNVLTRQVEYRGVFERSPVPEHQYWERFNYPSWFKDVTKREDEYNKKKKEDDAPFYDQRYEEYKAQEWDRRLNGFWVSIKGKAVYITGFYYMLLQWFQIDVGYAKFTKPHLIKTYFLQYCIEDPLCMGMIDITKRRFLKTFMGGLFILEYVTRTKMVNGALQSKTGNDAKKVFGKAVVYPFRKFPRFFRPEYDMSLGVNPKTEIRFQQTNIRGKKAEDTIDKDELGSMIDWGSADPIHYDGTKVVRYFSDEWGKTTEANIYDRHEVIRYCLLDEEGRIIGKALYSTTVEKLESDKDGVQQAARELWNASNQNKREKNGRTQSGLYRFFQTADEAKNFDIYGEPDIEKTVSEILADRESVENNIRSLSARMRKEPRTIDEAFSIDADTCIFNTLNIAKRRKQLEENPVYKRSVWFYRDENTQEAKWRDILPREKDFHWKISPHLDLSYTNANKFEWVGNLKKPARTDIGAISVDGYSNTQGGEKWGSKACGWIGLRANGLHRKKAVGQIFGRPKDKNILYEQVMLAAEFLGFEAYFEHNSDAYFDFFQRHMKILYLGIYPKILIDPIKFEESVRHRGTPTTPYSLTKQTDLGLAYFENDCDEIDFEDLFDDAEIFDPNNRTKSDKTVSFLILNAVLSEVIRKPLPPKAPLIRTFNQQKSLNGAYKNPALADY